MYQFFKQNSSATTNFNTQPSWSHYEDIVDLKHKSLDVNLELENIRSTPDRKTSSKKEIADSDIPAALSSLTPTPGIFSYVDNYCEISYYNNCMFSSL